MIDKDDVLKGAKYVAGAITLIILIAILTWLISPLFSILPDNWGYRDEDNGYTKYKETIPLYASMVIVGYSIYIYFAFKEEKRKSLEKDIIMSILNVKEELYVLAKKNDIEYVSIYNHQKQYGERIVDVDTIRVLDEAKRNTANYLEKHGIKREEIAKQYTGELHFRI